MSTIHASTDASILTFITENNMKMKAQAQTKTSEQKPTVQMPTRKISQQMRAVLLIFNADPYLMYAVSPFINMETETIYWDKIQKLPFGSGHKGAIRWAYGVWTDQMPKGNCFDGALSMSPHLQFAVLESLCLRWGLRGPA